MRATLPLVTLLLVLGSFPVAFAQQDLTLRGQVDGAPYVFRDLVSGDSLSFLVDVPSGERIIVDGTLLDASYHDAELRVYQGSSLLYSDRLSSSIDSTFRLSFESPQSQPLRFELDAFEVFGDDSTLDAELLVTRLKNYDHLSYRDSGSTFKNAETISLNTHVRGHLSSVQKEQTHSFTLFEDRDDMYKIPLKKRDYSLRLVSEGDLATSITIFDALGNQISTYSGQPGSLIEETLSIPTDGIYYAQVSYGSNSLEDYGSYQLSFFHSGIGIEENSRTQTASLGQRVFYTVTGKPGQSIFGAGEIRSIGLSEAILRIRQNSSVIYEQPLQGIDILPFEFELLDGSTGDLDRFTYEVEIEYVAGSSQATISLDTTETSRSDADTGSDAGDSISSAAAISKKGFSRAFIGVGSSTSPISYRRYTDAIDTYRLAVEKDHTYRFDYTSPDGLLLDLSILDGTGNPLNGSTFTTLSDGYIYPQFKVMKGGRLNYGNYSLSIEDIASEQDIISEDSAELTADGSIHTTRDIPLGTRRRYHFTLPEGSITAFTGSLSGTDGIGATATLYRNGSPLSTKVIEGSGEIPFSMEIYADSQGGIYELHFDVTRILGDRKLLDIQLSGNITSQQPDSSRTLSVSEEASVSAGYLASRTQAEEALYGYTDTSDSYSLYLSSGEKSLLTISPNSYLGVQVTLSLEDGSIVASGSSSLSGEDVTLNYTAEEDTFLTLDVSYLPLSEGYYGFYDVFYRKQRVDLYTSYNRAARLSPSESFPLTFSLSRGGSSQKFARISAQPYETYSFSLNGDIDAISTFAVISPSGSILKRVAADEDLIFTTQEIGPINIALSSDDDAEISLTAELIDYLDDLPSIQKQDRLPSSLDSVVIPDEDITIELEDTFSSTLLLFLILIGLGVTVPAVYFALRGKK